MVMDGKIILFYHLRTKEQNIEIDIILNKNFIEMLINLTQGKLKIIIKKFIYTIIEKINDKDDQI